MDTVAPDALLRGLAEAYGVDTEYVDWQLNPRQVAPASLRGVLRAFGPDPASAQACVEALAARRERLARPLPPCVVVRQSQPMPLPGATAAVVTFEDGRTSELTDSPESLPAGMPTGYHQLTVQTPDGPSSCQLVVTPDRIATPDPDDPMWGLAIQLYSVRSRDSWGLGDLADLAVLAEWSARAHGADFVLINPIHAAEVVAPMTPSPYLPTSRRFANPMYLRVEDIPEYRRLTEDEIARVGALRAHANAESELIDRDRSWSAKREALELVHTAGCDANRVEDFDRFRAEAGDELERFATWCTLCEQYGNDWRVWPAELRDPDSPQVASSAPADRVQFHCWLQWLLEEQLASAQRRARDAGMQLGIVHDLAVGVSPTGADAWSWQRVMANDVRVGAPPDAYSQKGQDWQQPPWRPDELAEIGYAPLRDLFRAALRHGGGVRIDHIIGLFRLWWIPDGADADAGTYVHYDADALIGILALEAERASAVVIGEDLGNVQPHVHEVMHERGLLGTSILWFEQDRSANVPLPPERWRADCLASVTTHDLPPTIGYLAGEHIRLRDRLGLLTRGVDEEFADARRERTAWVAELDRLGLLTSERPSDDEIVQALHVFLTRTPSSMRCVALTDAVGERRTQNQPGTSDEYPNWQIPLGGPDGRPILLEDLPTDERVTNLLAAMQG